MTPETIKQAKLRAVQEGSSLSNKVREYLQRYASGQQDTDQTQPSFVEQSLALSQQNEVRSNSAAVKRQQLKRSQSPSVDPGLLRARRGWAREDLYDRNYPGKFAEKPANVTAPKQSDL